MADESRTRPWSGWSDLPLLQAVCARRLAAAPGRAYAHPGDIAWWVGWPPATAEELAQRLLLWEEGGVVVGFAELETDHAGLTVIVDDEHLDTGETVAFEDEADAWARAAIDGPLRYTDFEDEPAIERWRARGFEPTEEAYLNLVRPLDPAVDLEAGDDVRAVADGDVAGRAAITHAAFGSTRPFDDYAAAYAGFRGTPAYPAGWDLIAVTPEGEPAACCIAWPDPTSGAGTFEPVATHPRFHRQGYGRAVLRAGIARLAAAGMRWVIVGAEVHNDGATSLYRSVGFEPDHVLRIYVRP